MIGWKNPVLNRELLVNLRTWRAMILLVVYLALLSGVVFLAWPVEAVLDLSENPQSTRLLVDLFFLGNFVLVSFMAPSFAALAISGERERKTFELLLASPLQPTAIVWGKLVAALTHLAVLVFSSLPVVMLCLPLGGVSIYEVLAAYVGLISCVVTFGMISIYCGSLFKRTTASLMSSYLIILPFVMAVVMFWLMMGRAGLGQMRLDIMLVVMPGLGMALTIPLFFMTASRLLYPPDAYVSGSNVIDLEQEAQQVVGLVLQQDAFPDKLFTPRKRAGLMNDGINPVFDKEMRSEIFGQGTLMLRLVIQISIVLAIPLMAVFLYWIRPLIPWYISYVLLFNMLIGPVFSAGSVTSERERQTLDLLLTTLLSPWQILWGKLFSGLRVSSVLTSFLLWPLLLAALTVGDYLSNLPSILAYMFIILLTCVTSASVALFCSTLFRKTSTSLIVTYLLIVALYLGTPAISFFATQFFPASRFEEVASMLTITSPFAAAHEVPIYMSDEIGELRYWVRPATGDPNVWMGVQLDEIRHFGMYTGFTLLLNGVLLCLIVWLFNRRWRVAY
ncbi:MAG TPA: ABC transporter permease subunit [Pirellulaceae bacterium]|nr:ABC transporter permease subunit [Pirellulaceae bacterium]